METITKQQMKEYVLSQPDEKPIDMEGHSRHHGVKCLMAQYSDEVLKEKFGEVGSHSIFNQSWEVVAKLDFDMKHFIKKGFDNKSKTFGELKKQILV